MSNYYKNRRSIEIKVGLFVIIGIVLLIVGVVFLQDIIYSGNRKEITIKFPTTDGLDPGDKVKVNGIAIGKITDIKLVQDGVMVKTLIQLPEFSLQEDSEFVASESGLMGGHHLEIIPGKSDQALDFSKVQSGRTGSSIFGMIDEAKNLVVDLSTTVQYLNDNLDIIDSTKALITNSDQAVQNLNSMVQDNSQRVQAIMVSLHKSTKSLEAIFTKHQSNIDTTLTNLPEVVTNLNANLDELKLFVVKLNTIFATYQDSDNTIKRLIEEKNLYEKLNKTIDNADSLLEDIKQNPKKYINLKVF
ncbi:MAG: MlaD family protein [Candidatus Cloacimonadales bacterium]